jgi:hypothetical protein
MNPTSYGITFAGGLFLGMVLLLETGRGIGSRRLTRDPEGAREGLGVVEGAVFSLLGLLIAFTFSGAATRFEGRRHLIVEEANNIGTAWQRIDLLPATAQPALRELFRRYLDSRLDSYRKVQDPSAAAAELARSLQLQGAIWTNTVAACHEAGSSPLHAMLLSALNPMFDVTTTRTEAMKNHPPLIIFVMIGVLSLVASLLAGYGMAGGKSRSSIHYLGFAAITALIIYVIVDIEYPRFGWIRVDAADRVLIELRESMK